MTTVPDGGDEVLNRQTLNALGAAATDIVNDYEQRRPPFDAVMGITTDITEKLEGRREKALFLTLASALNRQRDAERLYSKCERLYYDEHWIFEPESLIESRDFEELAELFEVEEMRFGRSDAEVWYEIARTLYQDFNSDPMNLLEGCDYDMQQLEERVRIAEGDTRFFQHGKKFPVLRGEKIRPMWLRLLSNQVHPLNAQGGSDVSVDTHIRKTTNRLLGTEYSSNEGDKEQIRQFWTNVCVSQPINPVDIDGPLWFIDRDWDDWGRAALSS